MRPVASTSAAFVLWVQDFYSLAVTRLLGRRLGPVGAAVGAAYRAMERSYEARPEVQVVLIAADSLETVQKTHSNFWQKWDFRELVMKALRSA